MQSTRTELPRGLTGNPANRSICPGPPQSTSYPMDESGKMQAGGRRATGRTQKARGRSARRAGSSDGRTRAAAHALLLDSSSLLYRAFFSVPHTVTDSKGRPVNAVHGYLDMTAGLVRTYRPDQIVHVYDDDWRPAPRVRQYAGYKAHRPPEPDAIARQFDVLRDILDAAGASQAEAPG